MVHLESYTTTIQLKSARDLFAEQEYNWHAMERFVVNKLAVDLYFYGNVGLITKLFKDILLKSLQIS